MGWGHNKFGGYFNTRACSFSHAGVEVEGGGGKKYTPSRIDKGSRCVLTCTYFS